MILAAAAALPIAAELPTVPRLIQKAEPVYCGGARGRKPAAGMFSECRQDRSKRGFTGHCSRAMKQPRHPAKATHICICNRDN